MIKLPKKVMVANLRNISHPKNVNTLDKVGNLKTKFYLLIKRYGTYQFLNKYFSLSFPFLKRNLRAMEHSQP